MSAEELIAQLLADLTAATWKSETLLFHFLERRQALHILD